MGITVRSQRTQKHYPIKSSLGVEKTLFKFEIRKTAYEILALKDIDTDGINQHLNFLYNLHIFEYYTEQILRDLDDVVIMPALFDKNKACLIADKIHEFFYGLAGPENVKIKKKDIDNLEIAIILIGHIGYFSAYFKKSLKVIKSVCKAYENIWDILIWYNLESHALMVLDKLDEISKACKDELSCEKPLLSGINELSKLRQKLKTITVEEQPGWKKVLPRLNK